MWPDAWYPGTITGTSRPATVAIRYPTALMFKRCSQLDSRRKSICCSSVNASDEE